MTEQTDVPLPDAVTRRRRAGVALVATVALLGSLLAGAATREASQAESRYAAYLMDRYAADLHRTIGTEIERYGDTLADVATALGAQQSLTSEEFDWITTRVSTRRLPGATAVAFVANTEDAGIPALQSYWRGRGATDLDLRPARSGIEHRFTIFTRAFDGRPVPTGRDLAGIPGADQALTDARAAGAFAVSRSYVLPMDLVLPAADRQQSFTFAVPVFRLGGTFRGWLAMGVHGRDLLEQTLQEQSHGAVAAELSDAAGPVAPSGTPAPDAPQWLARTESVVAGQRTWELRIRPTAQLLAETDRGMVLATLGVALLIVLLATALVAILASARNRAMAKVDEATVALREDIARRQEVETRLREREQELQRLALHDPLTGLANRTGLDARLAETVGKRTDIALLLLDLDDFKLVNDAYGHAAGDVMLTEFAGILRATVRAGDMAARIGGDEFVVLLTGIRDTDEACAAAERILTAAAASPVLLGEDRIPVRASIGVATPTAHETPKELQRRADIAMYEAKQEGTHGVRLHDPAMIDQRAADAQLGEELAGAVERDELTVLYQPLVDLADGRPLGVEALVRWEHPVLGVVSPVQFIPIAERTGSITGIGLAVLEEACRQIAAWGDGLYVSVNVSPRQLHEPTLVEDVLAVLGRAGLSPQRLVLEITESALVDEARGIEMLAAFRRHGIRVAVDDFGTGYSSLHYLTRLPIDILKIDRSFVAQLDGTSENAGIAEAVVRLSRALHLTTVAEGIETDEQAAELRLLGCGIGQGYLFARPMPAREALRVLSSPRPSSPS